MSEQFVVSARKYRPTRFSDVVGQPHVSQTLKHALADGRVAHAFLFCGPRGVGKTTNARILAKILNCTNRRPDFEACGTCDSCRAFEQNASFNIVELDAASKNSVEHIRALVEQVRFPPQQGKYKVFIIDEVHMLSQASFNAFLKTLEEPPPYAIFILATTEKHKIIPTILSRCQIFDFRRIQVPDIVLHLQKICDIESIVAEPDALHIIAQKADGALRDALSIFDRIVSASGKKLTYADVIENLNILDYDYFFRVTDAMLTEDVTKLLLIFDDILRKGFDAELFINGLAEHLRNLLVCKDAHTLALLEAGEALRERYRVQANLSPNSFIITALNLCNECDINFKAARNKRLHTEMALIKMAYISRSVDLLAMTKGIQNGTIAIAEKKNTPNTEVKPSATPPQYPSANPPQHRVSDNASEQISDNAPPEATPEAAHSAVVSAYIPANEKILETPQLASLDNIEKMLQEQQDLLKQLIKPLNLEVLIASWHKYAAMVESPVLRISLENAKLELHNKQIIARTGTQLSKAVIEQAAQDILNFLRFEFNSPYLTLEVLFDSSLVPNKSRDEPLPTRRFLSPRERLVKMIEVNPLVKDFANKFKLKPDEN